MKYTIDYAHINTSRRAHLEMVDAVIHGLIFTAFLVLSVGFLLFIA